MPFWEIEVNEDNGNCVNRKRVCAKIAVILFGVLLVLTGLAFFVDGQTINELKYNFSLELIIALVIIINLVSFLCFTVLYAAYQWIRRDLKPARNDDLDE